MRRIIFALLLISGLAQPVHAEAPGKTIDIRVLGLVCDFCARAVEKVFHERSDVQQVHVDLSAKKIELVVDPDSTIDDATIRQLVEDSGYSLEDISRGVSNEQ